MIIVGLTGGIGHGKTTFANLLAQQSRSSIHFESWQLVAEVAEALRDENTVHPAADDIEAINEWLYVLPDIISRHMHCTVAFAEIRLSQARLDSHPEHFAKLLEYLSLVADQPLLATGSITDETKETFRPLLQWLGGYLVITVGAGVWYDEIMRRIGLLRSSGHDLVTVGGVRYPADAERLRNSGGMIIQIRRPQQPDQDRSDITERDRSAIDADCIVMNSGSLDDLEDCAKKVYFDLSRRQLTDSYTSQLLTAKL